MGRLTKEQVEFIKNNVNLLTNQEIADKLGCSKSTVSNWRKKLGISFSETHNFSQYNQYIIDSYSKKTAKKIAEEIGCSKSYITKTWRENGLQGKINRQYYSDFDFFERIDNEDKAYVLGLLASDGCVYTRNNHEGLMQIALQKQDKEILEKIKLAMSSENPILENKRSYVFSIVSNKIYNDLVKIGITPKKTWDLDLEKIFSQVPFEYWKDFIRGYFDGDGCISSQELISNSNVAIAIPLKTGYVLSEKLKSIGLNNTIVEDKRVEHYQLPFCNIVFKNTTEKYCFLKYIYNTKSNLFLLRKREKASTLMKNIETNSTNRKENITAVLKWGELLENLRR